MKLAARFGVAGAVGGFAFILAYWHMLQLDHKLGWIGIASAIGAGIGVLVGAVITLLVEVYRDSR